ncbi:multiple sugar transport system ATP-binding protein [Catalinimonas alkaloidigena]|uniref:Multiple sugar transport system ATP-binding protein n=1 Tax=Catalinimonas alkaloidigena TaxID=1075417 RepID=A0A1G9E970_9BACT|nr:sn-glycerol-3-phosphate ABC transporter ATP-binding protein UgpC [Catalinimonas alkaloidigena]SDK72680.1 multiple sugar transport system ATP-binding protein [Catalinimonas alkaloidigena]
MAEVKLIDVVKRYADGTEAVSRVNLTIRNEEFMVLVGPSGCGKSTTLRMVAGLEDISAGDLYIGERRVNDVPPKDRDIAMVFQNYALYPHMTVRENMAFGLKLRGFSKQDIRQRVEEAARIVGLETLLERRPKALSGGQRQRVALGRAIVRRPAVFLFDEPLSNLDAELRVRMRTEIARLHRQLSATMLYVTHDQTEAMTMGDRIAVLSGGVLQQVDTPLQLYHHPVNKFVAGFIGSPSMNFVEGTLERHEGLRFVAQTGDWSLPLRDAEAERVAHYLGKPLTLGFRPEDVRYADDATATLRTRADVVEPLGSETYLYFTLAGQPLVARIPGASVPQTGETLLLDIRPHRLYFFDTTTGIAL